MSKVIDNKLKAYWQELARQQYPFYCEYVHRGGYRPARHHKLICEKLQLVEEGKILRLIICMPPQHGKSMTVSETFPSYFIGRDPDRKVIEVSYGEALAERFGRFNRAKIEEFGADLFGVTIRKGNTSATNWGIDGHQGRMISRGIFGSITGEGAKCFPAGTLVTTNFGQVPIEELENLPENGRILTYDDEGKEGSPERFQWKKKEAFKTRKASGLFRITTKAGRVVEATGDHRFYVDGGYRPARDVTPGDCLLCTVQKGNAERRLQYREVYSEGQKNILLLDKMQGRIRIREKGKGQMQGLREFYGTENPQLLQQVSSEENWKESYLSERNTVVLHVQRGVYSRREGGGQVREVLQQAVCGQGSFQEDVREGQSEVEGRGVSFEGTAVVGEGFPGDKACYFGEGRVCLCCLREYREASYSSYRQLADEQCGVKFGDALCLLSPEGPQGFGIEAAEDTVAMVEQLHGETVVYDIQVEGNHNFFANGILVHNCLLIDDPVKNREEAESETYRNKVWAEYTSTLRPRVHPTEGAIIIIMTRWHEDDLVGRLLKGKDAKDVYRRWEVLSLPAEAEETKHPRTGDPVPDPVGRLPGEPLWPEYGYDRKWLEETKMSEEVGVQVWSSLYQQRPTTPEGTMIHKEWFQFYRELPEVLVKIQTWDTGYKKGKDNDPSCCLTSAVCKTGYYLISGFNKKMEYPELILEMKLQWSKENVEGSPLNRVIVEDEASGQSAIQSIRLETALPVYPHDAQGKVAQVRAVSAIIEAGKVFLPENEDGTYEPWVAQLLEQCGNFPNAKHDEWVDVLCMALMFLRTAKKSLIHTSDEAQDQDDSLEHVRDERDGRLVHSEPKAEEPDKPRYNMVERATLYLTHEQVIAMDRDHHLRICKDEGFVPSNCRLAGEVVMAVVREGGDPCLDCVCSRDVCKGRPRRKEEEAA